MVVILIKGEMKNNTDKGYFWVRDKLGFFLVQR